MAISALLSALPIASVQANESCTPLTGKEAGLNIGRSSADRCLPGINPLQDQQWHLLNSGQNAYSPRGGVAGNDLNLWWAHRTEVLGQGINVAVVDDGLATGATMMSALKAVRQHHPQHLVCAIPVASPDALAKIKPLADETLCLHAPEDFMAVAQFYQQFPQVDDAQVLASLQTKFTA